MTYEAAEGVEGAEVFEARNVVRYRREFPGTEFADELKSFTQTLEEFEVHPVGPLFYSLNNVPSGPNFTMDIEFFMPVEEEYVSIPGMKFSSYFEVNNLIVTSVDHDYGTLTQRAYRRLLQTLDMNNRDVNTPFYHILDTDDDDVMIALGYAF